MKAPLIVTALLLTACSPGPASDGVDTNAKQVQMSDQLGDKMRYTKVCLDGVYHYVSQGGHGWIIGGAVVDTRSQVVACTTK